MRYSEFLKTVHGGTAPPVVTFLGEEKFLKEQALKALLTQFLDVESRAYNYRSISAEDLKDASFLDDASTLPMFGDRKVLYVKDAASLEKLLGRIKAYLEKYLEQPSAGTILIFDVDGWEGLSKLKGVLAKRTCIVEFNVLSEKEVPSWINSHLRTLGFQIDRAAIDELTDRLGTDLQKISAELEKLMLLRQGEKRITIDDVSETVGYSPTASIWQWADAILDQDSVRAIDLLEDLLEKGEQPVYCVAVLAKQYEKMIWTKEMIAQKVAQAVIAQKINKPIYYLQKYLDQLARFTTRDLVKAMQVLSFTDRAMKSSLAAEKTLLHLMTVQLSNLKAPLGPLFDVPPLTP